MEKFNAEQIAFIKTIMADADAKGSVNVSPKSGLFVQTAEDLTADAAGWDDGAKDFSMYKYWITTDDGAEPIGFDEAEDGDAVKFIGQYALSAE